MVEILQDHIPYDISKKPNLPGVKPLSLGGWLVEDEVFAMQMAERDRLISELPDEVFRDAGASFEAKTEVLEQVLLVLSCLLYTSPSPRDLSTSRMPSSA